MRHTCVKNICVCPYCNQSYCYDCKTSTCELCHENHFSQIWCNRCNGIIREQQHRLCYDCFVIAIMKRKIFFCYTCGTLCFSTLQTKHQNHNVEYNKKTLIHIAIKYYHVRKAFTLLEYDSDFDTL